MFYAQFSAQKDVISMGSLRYVALELMQPIHKLNLFLETITILKTDFSQCPAGAKFFFLVVLRTRTGAFQFLKNSNLIYVWLDTAKRAAKVNVLSVLCFTTPDLLAHLAVLV